MVWPAIIAAAAQIGGNMLANKASEDAQEDAQIYNMNEAIKLRDFQERMSSTAYQRAVEDMGKAGLNPMLAYSQGGASTPHGGQAQSPAPPTFKSPTEGAVNAGIQASMASAQLDHTRAQTASANAEAELKSAQAANERASPSDNLEDEHGNIRMPSYRVLNIAADSAVKKEMVPKIREEVRKVQNEVQEIASKTQLNVHDARLLIEKRVTEMVHQGLIRAETRKAVAEAILTTYHHAPAREQSRYADMTGVLDPALGSLGRAASSAFQLRVPGMVRGTSRIVNRR